MRKKEDNKKEMEWVISMITKFQIKLILMKYIEAMTDELHEAMKGGDLSDIKVLVLEAEETLGRILDKVDIKRVEEKEIDVTRKP